jgi:hypothetical protein
MLRPSSLPALLQCPCFESDSAGNEFSNDGTKRHAVLCRYLNIRINSGSPYIGPTIKECEEIFMDCDEESIEGIKWAADYIIAKSPIFSLKLQMEQSCEVILQDFSVIKGTRDYSCGSNLFDFKWRIRDYKPQMAAYALAIFQENVNNVQKIEAIRVHLLFGALKQVVQYSLSEQDCWNIINPIIDAYNNPSKQPKACDYCSWCSKQVDCPAVIRKVSAEAQGYSDGDFVLANWHPSKIATPEEMAEALYAMKVLKSWCKSVYHHAMEMATKGGQKIPGWEVKESKGKIYCANSVVAFPLAGLPQEQFLQACMLLLKSSTKYPDKVGIINLYAEFNKIGISAAKREIMAKLASVLKQGKSGLKLVEEKLDDNNEEANEE